MDASDELLRRTYLSAVVSLDGVIRRLNDPMASALGRPADECVGRAFADLLPQEQKISAERLVAQGASGKRLAMAVLVFPGPGEAPFASLIGAQPGKDPGTGEPLVQVRSRGAQNDLSSLLIPFRLVAKAGGIGLWRYEPPDRRLEWVGGAPGIASLAPEPTVSLSWAMARVHPDDRKALGRLLRSAASALSPWIEVAFRAEDGHWHDLLCQTRRIDLGYGGPTATFLMIRDETEQKTHQEEIEAQFAVEQERANWIAEFSSALIAATTEEGLQQVILTRLATAFGSAGALLALVDEETVHVSTDAGISNQEADSLHTLSLHDSSAVANAIRAGRPVFIGSREEYAHRWPHGPLASWFDQPGLGRAVLITPLGRADGRPLGAWAVTYDRNYRPSPDEQALMTTLADLAGQALRRVRLQQVRVELATVLQRSTLPTLSGDIPGLEVAARYRPSRGGLDIGGDWYDAFVLPNGSVAVEIGDVQGHDVEAAAFMGQVHMAMRAIADREMDPGTVLARVNELLVTTDTARFVSCTMLRIDPRDGQVTGASAGHVPTLCAHETGTYDVHELSGGPVLGVVGTADYPEQGFVLDRGSALVMVTDGLVEGPHLTLEAGLDRAGRLAAQALREGLSAEGVADRVLEAVEAVDHADDVAVLVIRRR